MMLSERLRPKKIASMAGNEHARLSVVRWLRDWKPGSKPLLLIGPPGVGKSSSIYAVADEFDYTIVELNASDVRTREKLRQTIGPILNNASLFQDEEKILVFLDEVDGLSGRSDYAGTDFILDFIENSSTTPLAMAANIEDDQRLKKLVQKSLVVRFNAVELDILFVYLKSISKREELRIPDDIIWNIVRNSRGDVRSAINSLQSLSREGTGRLESTDSQFQSDARALQSILAARDLSERLTLLRQFDSAPRDKVRYLYDTIVSAKNIDTDSRAESLDLIAQADLLLGRISRTQSWRLLRYLDRYLALAVEGKKLAPVVDGSLPWNLRLSIWNDGRVLKTMIPLLSQEFHVGKSAFASLYLPYISLMFKKKGQDGLLERFAEKNNLGDSEKRVLLKLGSSLSGGTRRAK